MLLDLYNRPVYNIRLSITSKCNLKCFYCHNEGFSKTDNEELSVDEIERIANLAASYGVKSVKLTGGEPLCRNDVLEIVHSISSISGLKEVSLVTNGQLLKDYALRLKVAGLKRVNVSLPTLDDIKYREITGGGNVTNVLHGIKEACDVGLNPVKINMVLLKGINENEVDAMISYSASVGAILQIIELEPVRILPKLYGEYHEPVDELESMLLKRAKNVYFRDDMHKRKIFELDSTKVEVVHPIENSEFCANCNRLRVAYNGAFKPCLMVTGNEVETKMYLKNKDYDGLRLAFLKAVMLRKPYCVK
ncbi:MAG: GTP 3',8-cyclase MoaA [Nitrososphaeria archaeon]|nr:GTP 3',8-cyclase MoaA [Nitrososphaeria archaeon]